MILVTHHLKQLDSLESVFPAVEWKTEITPLLHYISNGVQFKLKHAGDLARQPKSCPSLLETKETKENDNRKILGSYRLSFSSLGSVRHTSAEIQLGRLKCWALYDTGVRKSLSSKLKCRVKLCICSRKSFFDRLQRPGQCNVYVGKLLVRLHCQAQKEICGNSSLFHCQIQFNIFETQRKNLEEVSPPETPGNFRHSKTRYFIEGGNFQIRLSLLHRGKSESIWLVCPQP